MEAEKPIYENMVHASGVSLMRAAARAILEDTATDTLPEEEVTIFEALKETAKQSGKPLSLIGGMMVSGFMQAYLARKGELDAVNFSQVQSAGSC